MIQQPQLGRKIADHRKAMGFTQEELVDQCNLNVRTLQRIEAGEVTPRISTLKLIYKVLELDFDNSLKSPNKGNGLSSKWHKQFYTNFIDLFNLKTNTMRKITILSLIVFATFFVIFSLTTETVAQSDADVRKIIEQNNENLINWFNNGEVSSLVSLYSEDACLISRGCGKEFIENYFIEEINNFKITEVKTTSISVNDNTAVEKGNWAVQLNSGEAIGGEYLVEWKLKNKKWLIVSESMGLSIK